MMRNISKNKSVLVLVFVSFFVASCGGGGGSSTPSKGLFSFWNEVGTNDPLDLTGGSFSTAIPISFFFVGGEQCNCNLTVLGSDSSGSYVINSCSYKFGSGSGDPGCNALNDTGTYSNSAATLTITNSLGTVSTYK